MSRRPGRALACIAFAFSIVCSAVAQVDEPPAGGFAALEAAGARIGRITVRAEDIFDTSDPREDYALYRLANRLHLQTQPEVIRRQLLFASGEPVSVRRIEETERLLRANRYLYDVKFRPLRVQDGVVDIEVVTRDTWSLDIGASASRAGGSNSGGLHIAEYNLLGTGTAVSLGRSRNVDRSSTVFSFSHPRAFGSWTGVGFSHAVNSDGRRDEVSLVKPFQSLDARWSAGLLASRDDRLESVYRGGVVSSRYRHRQNQAEVFAGLSDGLVGGWVHRWSAGLSLTDDAYAIEPGEVAPPRLPGDQRLRAPFVRWELLEDRYDRELNRNLIGRPEFFALGLAATVQLGYATTGLGSTSNGWTYAATVSRGFEPRDDDTLVAVARSAGQLVDGQLRHHRLGLQAQYYHPQGPRWLLYGALAFDQQVRPDPHELLQLGGDDGLRGFPLRYQSGTHRALMTVEERFYTDVYPWRLFRLGGALFADVGKAWGGDASHAGEAGWLANVGGGLRIVNTRAAFSNVLHIDLALPLNSAPDLKKLQLLVKTKTSF